MANPTPHTGFEPASHYGPTVFKTAPSPPGHTAYKGDEDRTHTYGIKTRCEVGIPSESYRTPNGVWSSITLRPYHDQREIRTPGSAKTSRLPNIGICSKSLSHLLRRFGRVHSSTMLSGHTTAGGFEPPEQFPVQLLSGEPQSANSATLPYQTRKAGATRIFFRNPDQYLRQDSNLQSTD